MADKTPDYIKPDTFTITANPDAVVGQANETFKLDATENQALGKSGETVGFAKYKFNPEVAADIEQQRDVAYELSEAGQKAPVMQAYLAVQAELILPGQGVNNIRGQIGRRGNTDEDNQKLREYADEIEKLAGDKQKLQEMSDSLKENEQVKSSISATEDYLALKEKVDNNNNVALSSSALFTVNTSDPKVGNDRGLLTRAVASTAVDQFIGTNVVAEEKFATDSNGLSMGVSVQADGAGITGKYQGKNAFLDIDYSDPQIQRGLSDLEVADYLTGQIDRHGGNIFIDPQTKKVTGIDNDLAFPEGDREKITNDKVVSGLPKRIHKDTAEKIKNVDPAEYRKMLENMPVPPGVSKLSPAAIDQAVVRLENLQKAINTEPKPDGFQIVNQFDKQTYDQAIAEQKQAVKDYAKGVEMEDLPPGDEWKILRTERTSYLGTAFIQQNAYKTGLEEKPDEYTMRPPESAGLAQRDMKIVMKQVGEMEKKAGELKRQAEKYNARVESPSLRDKFRSLLPGKDKESIAKTNAEKRDNLLNEAAKLDQQRMGIIKREAEHGKVAVLRNQQNAQQNNQGQNQQPQVENVNLRETQKVEIQGEKLPTVGLRPNVLPPPTPELPKVPEVGDNGLNQENNGSLKRSNSDVAGLKKVGSGSLSTSSQKLESEIELKDSQNSIGSSANIKPTNDRPKVDTQKVGKGIHN